MFAHYVSTTQVKFIIISRDMVGREVIKRIAVKGKREARIEAARINATPWNF